ncbi:MAG: hypothetical protein COA69_07300 [Robiginitomaculum sp.]|nr:MAG: hypothetical protein COA69_07300 [Robiginitomaculum sp.]
MSVPFYINAGVLEKKWGSKYDVLMFGLFLIGMLGTIGVFVVFESEAFSLYTRLGVSGAYTGVIFGLFFHLVRQTRKGDEFSQKIITRALAQSGLSTIIYTTFTTLFQGMFDAHAFGMWTFVAPVLFLALSYMFARFQARNYTK